MANLTTYTCTSCGKPATRKRGGGKARVCENCGPANAVAAVQQMAARSGPAYEKWLASGGSRGRPRVRN